jgi:RND family efflux transporter MFP subunit
VRQAEAELARVERLRAGGHAPQDELDRLAGGREEARAGSQAAKAALERARLDLDATRVTAPIDGRAGRPLLDAGNLAGPATPLVTVVATDPAHAAFDVDERTFLRLRTLLQAGRPAALIGLAGDDGFPRRGRVEFADNRADPATGTVRVRAAFPNPGGEVVPGLAARVRVVTDEPRPALLVPEAAVGTADGRPYVLVVGPNDGVEWRAVTVGPADGGLRVVRDGLTAEDRVIVGGPAGVPPGARVRPREVPPAK